jgi:hypothetical protein
VKVMETRERRGGRGLGRRGGRGLGRRGGRGLGRRGEGGKEGGRVEEATWGGYRRIHVDWINKTLSLRLSLLQPSPSLPSPVPRPLPSPPQPSSLFCLCLFLPQQNNVSALHCTALHTTLSHLSPPALDSAIPIILALYPSHVQVNLGARPTAWRATLGGPLLRCQRTRGVDGADDWGRHRVEVQGSRRARQSGLQWSNLIARESSGFSEPVVARLLPPRYEVAFWDWLSGSMWGVGAVRIWFANGEVKDSQWAITGVTGVSVCESSETERVATVGTARIREHGLHLIWALEV